MPVFFFKGDYLSVSVLLNVIYLIPAILHNEAWVFRAKRTDLELKAHLSGDPTWMLHAHVVGIGKHGIPLAVVLAVLVEGPANDLHGESMQQRQTNEAFLPLF